MSLTDLLRPGRIGLAGRLPARLEDLHGPERGVIVLPRHLSWPGMREFDVTDDRLRRSMYGIVLTQGRRNDLARFVNPRLLTAGLAAAALVPGPEAAALVRAAAAAARAGRPGRRQPAAGGANTGPPRPE